MKRIIKRKCNVVIFYVWSFCVGNLIGVFKFLLPDMKKDIMSSKLKNSRIKRKRLRFIKIRKEY